MKHYELLFIVAGDKTEEEATKVADAVGAKVLELGGKAKEQNPLGRRRLAYPIGKQDHGWYSLLHFELEADKANDLARALNVMNDVLRIVLVSADQVPKPGEIHQTPTAVEESKEASKVSVPEELRKTAKPVATTVESKPAAETEEAEAVVVPEELKKTPAKPKAAPKAKTEKKPAKKVEEKDLEAALEQQLKD